MKTQILTLMLLGATLTHNITAAGGHLPHESRRLEMVGARASAPQHAAFYGRPEATQWAPAPPHDHPAPPYTTHVAPRPSCPPQAEAIPTPHRTRPLSVYGPGTPPRERATHLYSLSPGTEYGFPTSPPFSPDGTSTSTTDTFPLARHAAAAYASLQQACDKALAHFREEMKLGEDTIRDVQELQSQANGPLVRKRGSLFTTKKAALTAAFLEQERKRKEQETKAAATLCATIAGMQDLQETIEGKLPTVFPSEPAPTELGAASLEHEHNV